MDKDKSELRWGIEQRLEFIEFRLFWEGHVNRIDVMQQFGVSVNQASSDLNRYIALAPDNMVYDKSARTYARGPDFDVKFRPPDAAHYLAQLRLVADDVLEREDCWIPDRQASEATDLAPHQPLRQTRRSVRHWFRRLRATPCSASSGERCRSGAGRNASCVRSTHKPFRLHPLR